jgi:hypothetical protein
LSERRTTKDEKSPAKADTAVAENVPIDGDELLVPDADWPEAEHDYVGNARTRRLTPVRLGLLILLAAAAGFIGGVLVQKSHGGASSASVAPAGLGAPGAGAGAAPGAGRLPGASGGATFGTVSNVDGRKLYVTDSSGATLKVIAGSGATITRSATAKAGDVHPGDTVIVQGEKNKAGTVKAQSITATAKGASQGGPPGFGAPGAVGTAGATGAQAPAN